MQTLHNPNGPRKHPTPYPLSAYLRGLDGNLLICNSTVAGAVSHVLWLYGASAQAQALGCICYGVAHVIPFCGIVGLCLWSNQHEAQSSFPS